MNTTARLLIAAAFAAAVGAAETTPPVDPVPPSLNVSAGNGQFTAPTGSEARSGVLNDGVVADYGGLRIAADTVTAAEAAFRGSAQPVLDTVRLSPGPKGPGAELVTLDSQECQLPRVGFRGMIAPHLVRATRQPAEPTEPATVRYLVDLQDVGDFAGRLRRDGRWVLYEGWADHAELLVSAQLGERGLTGWSLDAIVMHGSEKPLRKAELRRPAQPANPPDPAVAAGAARATTIRLEFSEGEVVDGSFSGGIELDGAADLLPAGKRRR